MRKGDRFDLQLSNSIIESIALDIRHFVSVLRIFGDFGGMEGVPGTQENMRTLDVLCADLQCVCSAVSWISFFWMNAACVPSIFTLTTFLSLTSTISVKESSLENPAAKLASISRS
jgi:hypothetical protein